MVAAMERSSATIIAASYERVSTRKQGQLGYSLTTQHQSLDDFAVSNGWALPEHLRFRDGEDADASGADWDLPGLTAMLDAARDGEFGVLIVPDLDRLARSLAKGLVLQEQLKKYGVRVVFLRVPTDDTPEGDLLKNQLLTFAQYERDKFRLRTMLNKRTKARLGEVVGAGPAPYGYRYTTKTLSNGKSRTIGLAPDAAEAVVVERIFALLATRSSIEVADQLNAEGVPAPRGARWLHAVVYAIARNRLYTGVWTYGKHAKWAAPGTGIDVAVPPIVSDAVWDEAQTALQRRQIIRRGQTPRDADPYLLRGLLTCGLCGHPLRTDRNGRIRYYLCACYKPSRARRAGKQPCALPAVHAEAMEGELWRVLSETLLDPAYLAAGLERAREEREDANRTREDRIAAYDRQIVAGRRTLSDIATQVLGALTDGGEFSAIIRQRVADSEALIARFTAERDALAGLSAAGLTEDDAADIAAFAARMVAGLGAATPADKRALYELLRVRGTVIPAADGVRVGRKHRFSVDWTAALPLQRADGPQRDSAAGLEKPMVLFRSGGIGPSFAIVGHEQERTHAA